ncbi:hypothetical protein I0Q91_00310 [Halanaerobiaceae bacterium Z-7014]|uniref:HepT-like domain-containing protein n=1 Tax=Halonatronomonas betaini TaxID=2778430 RepID=A0A931F6E8_9FIRM|nr:hypothetical protein [Halonatronomonas betaini]MBF8435506.1 hypothetical protein [Halonatronomonas betaini]
MNKPYFTLISRIENELDELDKVVEKINSGWERIENTYDELILDSIALNLHDYYAGLERIFELIATEIDDNIPQGESWHQDLLNQMKISIKKVRPQVISKEIANKLDEYRGFRHIVRNVYTFNLSKERIKPLVKNLSPLKEEIRKDIEEFIDFLEDRANS